MGNKCRRLHRKGRAFQKGLACAEEGRQGLREWKENSGVTCFGNKSIYGSVEDEGESQSTLGVKGFHSVLS